MSREDSENNHNYTEAVGTRLSPKTKRQFDRFKEEQEVGNAEALRRLTRSALNRDPAAERRPAAYLSFAAGVAYIVLSIFGPQSALDPLFGVFIISVGAWAAAPIWRGWPG